MSFLSALFDHFDESHEAGLRPIIWCSIAAAKDRRNPIPDTAFSDNSACGELALLRTQDRKTLSGWSRMVFSDRVAGSVTGDRDNWRVEISRDGDVFVTLLDWVPDRAFQLSEPSFFEANSGGQFMTGILNEVNGTSLISMSFDRGLTRIIR